MQNSSIKIIPQPKIQELFPTAVLFGKVYRSWTKEENEFFEEISKNKRKNDGNSVSVNRYVLDHPAMSEIRKEYQFYLNYYMTKIYAPKYPLEAYITQSWINYTSPGEFHHKHAHSNSFLSGCIYINADRDVDEIKFFKNTYQPIFIPTDVYNDFNCESWWFPVGTGDIVIFPSYLTHMVEQTKSTDTRVSIAINTFLKGYIGDEHSLTGLHLQGQDTDAPQRTEVRPEDQQGGY